VTFADENRATRATCVRQADARWSDLTPDNDWKDELLKQNPTTRQR